MYNFPILHPFLKLVMHLIILVYKYIFLLKTISEIFVIKNIQYRNYSIITKLFFFRETSTNCIFFPNNPSFLLNIQTILLRYLSVSART